MHHGLRVAMLLTLGVGVALLFPDGPGIRVGEYDLGVVSDRDVIAQVRFDVPQNPEILAEQRQAAEAAVPSTFEYRPGVPGSVAEAIEGFFAKVDSGAAAGGATGVTGVLSMAALEASADEITLLTDSATSGRLRRTAASGARDFLSRGVITPEDAATLGDSVRIIRGGVERITSRGDVLSGREYYDGVLAGLDDAVESLLLRKVLAQTFQASLELDEERTRREKDAASAAVRTVIAEVLEGEAIVRANQQVGPTEQQKLEAYRSALRAQGIAVDGSSVRGAVGRSLLNTMLLGIFGLLVYLFRPHIYRHFRTLVLVAGLMALYFLTARVLHLQGIPASALPVVFVAISLAIQWDGRLALLTTFVLAAVTVLQEPFARVDVLIPLLIGGAAASFSVRAFRRLAQTWVFIAMIAGSYALAIFGMQLSNLDYPFLSSLAAALVSTVICAILAIGFLPVFEWFTGITSDQTLLGWTDTNRPLLRRLAMEAPGTYAHTIQVANLAEAGADAIGANALLCRVGMYYHDIGKMLKPAYFIENQQGGGNPHDTLDPRTSAEIVREHVVEGLRLAEKEKVPPAILDFISEHHGNQTIGFFYRKAQRIAEEEGQDPPSEGDFRYPGPRPQSRETAIAMLADAAESATRALQDPTEERVKDLVKNIFSSRVESGQLNDSPLTLKDLAVLEARFGRILASSHHQRIDYPETRHLTDRAPAEGAGDGASTGPPAGDATLAGASGGVTEPTPADGPTATDPSPGKGPGSKDTVPQSAADATAPSRPVEPRAPGSLMWEKPEGGEGDGS
ncbi:MAG: HDIG domain-containing protein [Gemmatimonadetes bacterium]|nr:HDIG domain-containing protein [Gemmatimonadota bacterium]